MKIKIIFMLSFLLFKGTLFAYKDIGKWGEDYEIKEKFNFNKDINSSVLSQKNIFKAIKKGETSLLKLPNCQESKNRKIDLTKVLDHDIVMPKYNIHIKKGTTFNPLDYATLGKYILAINGSDKLQVAFANHYKNVSIIIVYNGSVDAIQEGYQTQSYIATKGFQETFKVKCLPSFYIQEKKHFLVKEINIKNILNGEGK